MTVRIATPEDRPAVVATFVAAFAADPAVRWFLPDDETYPAEAAAMGGGLFDARVGHGTVWVADGGAAVAMWDPPRSPGGPGVEHTPQAGRFGRYQRVMHGKMPETPHWYLGVVTTHPEHRGRRLGRTVLAAGLARAAEDGLPAYLETSNPRNVEVYRSVGFEVAEEVSVDDLPVWIMRADPRTTS